MTSVASEASAAAHPFAKSDRATRPTGMRGDGAFATLMESEARPEPQRSAKPDEKAQPRETERAADKQNTASGGSSREISQDSVPGDATQDAAPAANASDSTEPVEPTLGQAPAVDVPDISSENGSPDSAVAATPTPPAVPTVEPSAVPVAAIAQALTAPATATPEAGEAEQAAPSVTPVPQASDKATPAAASATDGTAQSRALPETTAPQFKAAEASPTAKNDEIKAQAPEMPAEPTGDAGTQETPQQAKQGPTQPAPVRPDAVADKPGAQPQTSAPADDPAHSAQPNFDPSSQPAQLAAPASAHSAGQAITPQSAPVSAAQPVPVNAIAVEIASQARAGNSRFEIRLDPPELGRIDVRLDIDREGNVTSRLVIERADTYDLLRRDQSTLERALQQAGLKTSEQGLEFSLRDQGLAQQRRDPDDLPRGTRAVIQETEVPPSEAASGYARLLGARSGIDIRV